MATLEPCYFLVTPTKLYSMLVYCTNIMQNNITVTEFALNVN